MSSRTVKLISESNDPKKTLQELIKEPAKTVEVLHGRVLVALYIAPAKSKGGIILTDSTRNEDIWQSCVGLVIKSGPIAFQDDETNKFGGVEAKPGDWVYFTPGEGRRTQVGEVDCRIIEDTQLLMKLSDPSIVTHYR